MVNPYSMGKFDAYVCTVAQSLETVRESLFSDFRYGIEAQQKPLPRYDDCIQVDYGCDRVYRLDGQRKTGSTLVTTSGELCPDVVKSIRARFPVHGVSRVDSCRDFTGMTVFEDMDALLVEAAMCRGLKLNQHGDWTRKNGRTRYIGSTKSPVMVRLYEKGYEQLDKVMAKQIAMPEDFDITLTRLEAQVRPASRDKQLAATYTPDDVTAYADWSKWVHSMMFAFDLASPQKESVRRSPHEKKMEHMCEQYGRTLLQELANKGGVLEDVAKSVFDLIAEQQRMALRSSHRAKQQ